MNARFIRRLRRARRAVDGKQPLTKALFLRHLMPSPPNFSPRVWSRILARLWRQIAESRIKRVAAVIALDQSSYPTLRRMAADAFKDCPRTDQAVIDVAFLSVSCAKKGPQLPSMQSPLQRTAHAASQLLHRLPSLSVRNQSDGSCEHFSLSSI